tara:strand:- start:252 stop:473 length:222 start_codon:yes stop_codon:yes gene_type:complete
LVVAVVRQAWELTAAKDLHKLQYQLRQDNLLQQKQLLTEQLDQVAAAVMDGHKIGKVVLVLLPAQEVAVLPLH